MKTLPARIRGFTLVEVVLSLGLVGFALIAVLAFFPAGLSSNRSSIDDTRAAQLASAVIGTIDSQCSTFGIINCYGLTLDLTSLTTMSETTPSHVLYASYPSPNQPSISSTQTTDSIYTIELRFENNPSLTSAPPSNAATKLGAGKANLIQIRVYGSARVEGAVEFLFLARNKS